VAAYLGAFGSVGATAWLKSAWGLPIGAVLLSGVLAALAWRAVSSRAYGALALGVCGASALLSGKFLFESTPLLIVGSASLLIASLWSARLSAYYKSTALVA
jgi:hypothetical protein